MLKKLVLSLFVTGMAVTAFGQGTVNFNTTIIGTGAQVRNSSGVLASGTGYFAQLYAVTGSTTSESGLVAVGSKVNFRGGTAAGYVQHSGSINGNAVDPNVVVTAGSSGPVTLQLRAWSSAFATYDAAVSGGGEWGKSTLLTMTPGYAPNPPADLVGLTGFTMVPEPSTIALGVLGAGSLLFIRRRK